MVAVNQNDLRIRNAENLIDSFKETNPYVFIGRTSQWESDVAIPMVARQRAGDMSPPYPENNFKDFYRVHDNMMSLKKVQSIDVHHLIPRIPWISGTTYDMYRHDYNEYRRSTSNAKNLYDCVFYVLTQSRDVYVCLDNNKGVPSIVEPQSTTDEPFYTSDGYQWMRLYTVSTDDLRNHSTNNFIPVTDNEIISTTPGAVYTVVIESAGNFYTDSPAGAMNVIPYYYCHITGDGTGAIARLTVSDGRISTVRIVEEGQDYTYGVVDFVANRVYASISDLKQGINALNPSGDGTLNCSVIISPPGGWGYDKEKSSDSGVIAREKKNAIFALCRQLGSTRVGVFSSLKSDLNNDFIEKTLFRQVGIVQNLKGVDGSPETLCAHYAVKVTELVGSEEVDYMIGEEISQQTPDETDPTIKYTAKGMVIGWDPVNNILRYVQDPFLHLDGNHNKLFRFVGNQKIIGDTSHKESTPEITFSAGTETTVGSITFKDGYSVPEFEKYSGDLIYLTNQSPILRQEDQTERISLIISY